MKRKTQSELPLRGKKILVVEDEFLIAVVLEEALRDAGTETVRVATVRAAMRDASGEAPLSAALLDVRLGRHTTEEVADALASRGIPFLFYSGQGLPDCMRDKHPKAELLMKPVPPSTIVDAVGRIAKA